MASERAVLQELYNAVLEARPYLLGVLDNAAARADWRAQRLELERDLARLDGALADVAEILWAEGSRNGDD